MATFYSTIMESGNGTARTAKAGEVVQRVARYNTSAKPTTSDAIQVVKVPHGAEITRIYVAGKTTDGDTHFAVGTSATAALFGSATISATAFQRVELTTALPYKVSVSDSATARYLLLVAAFATVSASATTTNSYSFVVEYVCNGA